MARVRILDFGLLVSGILLGAVGCASSPEPLCPKDASAYQSCRTPADENGSGDRRADGPLHDGTQPAWQNRI